MIVAVTETKSHERAKVVGLLVLKALLGVAFLAAGGAKLAGAPAMVAVFEKVGAGQWFRYVTGVLETAGAIGLFLPRFTRSAAALLALVMIGAIAAHLIKLGGNPTPPIVLLILSALVIWLSAHAPAERNTQ